MKSSVSRILNLLLWFAFCALSGTGLLLAFRLPPGSRGGAGLHAIGLTRHEWGDWHTWIGYLVLALLTVHLVAHWRWFWQVAARKRSWPLVLGIASGLILMAFLIFQPVSHGSAGNRHQNRPPAERGP